MADQPNRMSKNLMNSPYYTNYSQSASKGASNFNARPVGQASVAHNNGARTQQGLPRNARPIMSAGLTPAPQYTPKQIKKMQKQRKRESSHFFIMRKGVCFFMFIVCVLIVAALALSFLKVLPQYTSLFAIPDNTTQEDRLAWEEAQPAPAEGEEAAIYEDKTVYIGVDDYVYGILNNLFKLDLKDEAGVSLSANYDKTLASLKEKATEDDSMGAIAIMVYEYFPIVFVILAITAVITLITSFLGMFGKRIFKCFGLSAIIMLVCSAVVLVAGLTNLGNAMGNPSFLEDGTLVSVLDFGNVVPFLTRLISGAPLAIVDPLTEVAPVAFCGGFALLILLVAPILLLILSIFARRKLPYSIFDK